MYNNTDKTNKNDLKEAGIITKFNKQHFPKFSSHVSRLYSLFYNDVKESFYV